jgi:hypothetical protein
MATQSSPGLTLESLYPYLGKRILKRAPDRKRARRRTPISKLESIATAQRPAIAAEASSEVSSPSWEEAWLDLGGEG